MFWTAGKPVQIEEWSTQSTLAVSLSWTVRFATSRLVKKLVHCAIIMASCLTNCTTFPEVGDKPHKPKLFQFPQREFRNTHVTKRSFQPQWFEKWTWIHYSEGEALAFCFLCIVVYQNEHLNSVSNLEQTFISTGFTNWKDATSKFKKHENSQCHKEAVLKSITLPVITGNVGEMLSSHLAKQWLERTKCFLKLSSNACFLPDRALHFTEMTVSQIPILWYCLIFILRMAPNSSPGQSRGYTSSQHQKCRMRWWKLWLCTTFKSSQQFFKPHHLYNNDRWNSRCFQQGASCGMS